MSASLPEEAATPKPPSGVLVAHEPGDGRAAGGLPGRSQREDAEGRVAHEPGDRAVRAAAPLDCREQVPAAEAPRVEPGAAQEQHGALDLADVREPARPPDEAHDRAPSAPLDVERVAAGRSETEAGPARVERRRALARRGAEAAVGVLRPHQVALGPVGRRGRQRGLRQGETDDRRRQQQAARGGARRRRPAHLEAAPVALERPYERRSDQQAEHHVADRVGEVVRQRAHGDDQVGVEVLPRAQRPLVDVHPGAEGEPREPARRRQDEPARLAPAQDAREQRAAHPDGSPARHLPHGPGPLREEDVRHDRRHGADGEARQGAERVAGEQDDVGGRLDVRHGGEHEPPHHRERGQRRHQRQHSRRRPVALVPGEAGGHGEREQRERRRLPGHASTSSIERALVTAAAPASGVRAAPSVIRATSVEK